MKKQLDGIDIMDAKKILNELHSTKALLTEALEVLAELIRYFNYSDICEVCEALTIDEPHKPDCIMGKAIKVLVKHKEGARG